jgi:23S rRNA pseudouridine2457 synthase
VLIAFHKPFGVLSQFTPDGSDNRPLAEFGFPKGVYAIGRLDADSEGLLLLSEEPAWNAELLQPRRAHAREYWAQVERIPSSQSLETLARGVLIQGSRTLPGRVWRLNPQPRVAGNDPISPVPPGNQFEPPRDVSADEQGIVAPILPPRDPPIRFRKNVPDCWIALELIEGRNRQVRRMTAAIGHPTLRLLRVRIGQFLLGDLPAGQWRILTPAERKLAAGE